MKIGDYFTGKLAAAKASDDRLHPDQEAEVLRRHQDGSKPIPWERVKARLGL